MTAQMWDWWFGCHSTDAARYTLWHPGAHLLAALGEDRSADRTLTDRQRHVGNVSYVDEFVGAGVQRLAIRFVDPARLGFTERLARPLAARLLRSPLGRGPLASIGRSLTGDGVGRDLLAHCASEMNHLAAFLPRLYAEFRDVP